MEPLDALVIAPHPDDAELGMGGTIVRMLLDGMNVGILDLTNGEPTPNGSIEIRARETAAATQVLGVSWRENLGLPNRSLVATLEARAELANVLRRVRPRWLFAPYWTDAHPDHVAAVQLIEDARFWSKLTKSSLQGQPFHPSRIIHYFCVHLRLAIQPSFIVDISAQWKQKRESLLCYHSQFVAGREQEQPSFIDRWETMAAYWGQMIGAHFGEPFACREPLGLSAVRDILQRDAG